MALARRRGAKYGREEREERAEENPFGEASAKRMIFCRTFAGIIWFYVDILPAHPRPLLSITRTSVRNVSIYFTALLLPILTVAKRGVYSPANPFPQSTIPIYSACR